MAKKSAANRIETARAALEVITKQITELDPQPNGALLSDNDDLAVKLFGKLETLRAVAREYADKIALLESEAERERAAEIVRRHKVIIGRLERTLGEADETAAKAGGHLMDGLAGSSFRLRIYVPYTRWRGATSVRCLGAPVWYHHIPKHRAQRGPQRTPSAAALFYGPLS